MIAIISLFYYWNSMLLDLIRCNLDLKNDLLLYEELDNLDWHIMNQ